MRICWMAGLLPSRAPASWVRALSQNSPPPEPRSTDVLDASSMPEAPEVVELAAVTLPPPSSPPQAAAREPRRSNASMARMACRIRTTLPVGSSLPVAGPPVDERWHDGRTGRAEGTSAARPPDA
jgi:hypothetical protein